MDPILIFRGQRVQQSWRDEAPNNVHIKASPTAYVNKAIFLDFGRMFVRHLEKNQLLDKPVLLILDGHHAHLFNWPFLQLMKEYNITVLAIPPHTSHSMQPLDRGPFYSLKSWWNKYLYKSIRQKGGRKLTRAEWYDVFMPAYLKATSVRNIQGGFRVTGIYPRNRKLVLERVKKFEVKGKDDLLLDNEDLDGIVDTASESACRNKLDLQKKKFALG
jgi:hypothetical protein